MAGGGTPEEKPGRPYAIEFKTIDDWETPATQNVTIAEGTTTHATGTYIGIIEQGCCRSPSSRGRPHCRGAVAPGGHANVVQQRATEADVDEGDYLVEFKPVATD